MNAQIVNIPDANFKAKLLEATSGNFIAFDILNNPITIDINNDNEIQVSEALLVYKLHVNYNSITSIVGIESFQNLNYLNCSNTSITSLNLSMLTNLETLECSNSLLNDLTVSGMTNLKNLYLSSNQLTVLQLTNMPNLEVVLCGNNFITSINLSGTTSLYQLTCTNNLLTNIDVNAQLGLTILYVDQNFLTSLTLNNLNNLSSLIAANNQLSVVEISNCPQINSAGFDNNLLSNLNILGNTAIKSISIKNNSFTNVDFLAEIPNLQTIVCSNNPIPDLSFVSSIETLTWLECSNTLITTLDLSNNHNFTALQATNNPNLISLFLKFGHWNLTVQDGYPLNNNPNLQYVCVDDFRVATFTNYFASQNMNNVVVNSYCTFTPGINYNTISGTMTFDSNSNGCDVNDLPQSNIKIKINDGTNEGAAFTGNNGTYNFYTQTGEFILTPDVENPSWFNFSPASATLPLFAISENVTTQNFCITPNGIHPDLEVVLVPIIPARPGFNAVYKIVYKNKGNQTVNGIVFFDFNYAYMDFVNSVPVPSNGSAGYYGFNFTDLAPFETRSILVTLNINAPTETNPVNIGDVLEFDANVILTSGATSETETDDNLFTLNQTVVGSFDPNDITCLQGNALPTTEIGGYLHYNIRFENTGTAPAENIVVKNVIDLTQYNIQSLQVMESSHPVTIRVTGNIAEFIFQGINLDTGGHGNILLKLKSNTTLTNNLVVNSADIFFDYNFPIVTNDEQTIFADLSKNDFNKDISIQVYPNPAENEIYIKSESTITSIQLYDGQGRLLLTKLIGDNLANIDLTSYSAGMYFLTISSDKGIKTEKIIKK